MKKSTLLLIVSFFINFYLLASESHYDTVMVREDVGEAERAGIQSPFVDHRQDNGERNWHLIIARHRAIILPLIQAAELHHDNKTLHSLHEIYSRLLVIESAHASHDPTDSSHRDLNNERNWLENHFKTLPIVSDDPLLLLRLSANDLYAFYVQKVLHLGLDWQAEIPRLTRLGLMNPQEIQRRLVSNDGNFFENRNNLRNSLFFLMLQHLKNGDLLESRKSFFAHLSMIAMYQKLLSQFEKPSFDESLEFIRMVARQFLYASEEEKATNEFKQLVINFMLFFNDFAKDQGIEIYQKLHTDEEIKILLSLIKELLSEYLKKNLTLHRFDIAENFFENTPSMLLSGTTQNQQRELLLKVKEGQRVLEDSRKRGRSEYSSDNEQSISLNEGMGLAPSLRQMIPGHTPTRKNPKYTRYSADELGQIASQTIRKSGNIVELIDDWSPLEGLINPFRLTAPQKVLFMRLFETREGIPFFIQAVESWAETAQERVNVAPLVEKLKEAFKINQSHNAASHKSKAFKRNFRDKNPRFNEVSIANLDKNYIAFVKNSLVDEIPVNEINSRFFQQSGKIMTKEYLYRSLSSIFTNSSRRADMQHFLTPKYRNIFHEAVNAMHRLRLADISHFVNSYLLSSEDFNRFLQLGSEGNLNTLKERFIEYLRSKTGNPQSILSLSILEKFPPARPRVMGIWRNAYLNESEENQSSTIPHSSSMNIPPWIARPGVLETIASGLQTPQIEECSEDSMIDVESEE